MKKALSILFILLSSSNINCHAREIYVSKAINLFDVNDGGKVVFNTIQEAVERARPGDIVTIREGVYYENVSMKTSGNEDDRITVKSHKDEKVIINGSLKNEPAFKIENAKYIVIDGLEFIEAKKYGIVALNSSYVRITNCMAYDNQWEGFLGLHASNVEFIACIGHDNICDSFNFNDCKDSIMRDCIQYNGGNGLSIERQSKNIIVEKCLFYNNWADAILVYKESESILLKDNIIYDCHYKDPLDNGQGHGMKITHGNNNVMVINNKIAKCTAAAIYEIADNGPNIIYDGNIFSEIGARIPKVPKKAWKDDIIYKGSGDYPKFIGCAWYNLKEIEKNCWGKGNRYDDSEIIKIENKIKELKSRGIIADKEDENPSNK
ncbi:MAG: right-handed parallel beta-helix repeat-containing protein [Candidatus Omnitrophota bacterium]